MSVLDQVAPAAVSAFRAELEAFGLGEMAEWAAGFIGVDDATFTLELEQQPAYRARFAPVFERRARIAEGEVLPPLTPAAQIDYERRTRDLESFYGLPAGFIDVGEAIAGDVSNDELWARAALARNDAEAAYATPEGRQVIDELLGQPGVTPGSVVAFYLDPDKTLPEIQRATETAQVAAAAGRSEFTLSTEEALALRDAGFDPNEIQQRAAVVTNAGDLRFGVGGEFGALSRDQEIDLLEGVPSAQQNLQRRARQLQSRFEGGGSFATDRLGAATGLGTA
jgi:hypothetical protein